MLLLRSLAGLVLLVAGAAGGLSAALVHQRWWGLLLGLAVGASTTLALPAGGLRLAFMLGWFAAIGFAVWPRSEGDYLIPSSASGYAILAGSFVLFLTALVTLPRPGSRRHGGDDDPGVSTP